MAQEQERDKEVKNIPSAEDKELVQRWYEHYTSMSDVMDASYRYFNDRTLIGFMDDSEKRFNGYTPPRSGKYDWQAHVFSNATRNKTMALFAKMGLTRPEVKLVATPPGGLPSKRLAKVVMDAYNWSENKNNASMQYFFETLEAAVKGTVVTYEGYLSQYRKIKEIDAYNPITGKIAFREKEIKEYNDCYSEIVNLADFFIWNIYEPEVQNQERIIWRKRMTRDRFRYLFAKYNGVDKVKTQSELTGIDAKTFYGADWTIDLESEQIEVLYCLEKSSDEFNIIANGVVLQKGPFPWKHKRYPFCKTIFEPFASAFFYGNSLANKMQSDQDVLNTLYNMALDKTYLSIFPPILDSTINEIEDELLVPGRRMPVEDTNSMRELNIKSVDSGQFNMLQFVSRNIDLASVSETAQGQTGSGSTAREVILAEENARRLAGLFNMFMEDLVYQKALLKIPNILQFYTAPEKVEKVFDKDSNGKEVEVINQVFKEIRLDDVELEEGRVGTRLIRIKDSAPGTREELKKARDRIQDEEEKYLRSEEAPIHIVEVPGSAIRNLDLFIQIVKGSGYNKNKSTLMALELEYIKYASTIFPELADKVEMYKDLLELYDKDPEKAMVKGQQPAPGAVPPAGGAQTAGRGAGQTETVRNIAGRNQGNRGVSMLRERELRNMVGGDLSGV